jgi:branched-chain amino acid transport system permease protein
MAEPTPVQSRRQEARRGRLTRPAALALAALLAVLVLTPLLIPSFRVLDLAAKIMIFAVAVAAYDLIIGYTGIISFAHAMFFGLGAYCLALPIYHFGPPSWLHFPLALVLAVVLSVILSLVIEIGRASCRERVS